MNSVQAHAAQVRLKVQELEGRFPNGDALIVSTGVLNTTAGATVQCPLGIAADRLVSGSGRLAERAEIEAWEKDQAEQARAIRAAAPPKGTVYFKDGKFRI
jgi:hypothetical protein